MEAPVLPKRVFRFGLFQVDSDGGKLLRAGVPIRLQEQPLRVLCLLLEQPGEIVTREAFQQSLWPEGTYVEFDGSLNAALKRLRFALGDDADNPTFIETVPRRGYRFIAPVSVDAPRDHKTTDHSREQAAPLAATQLSAASRPRVPIHIYVVGGLVLLLLVAAAVLLTHRKPPVFVPIQANTPVPQRKSVAVLGFHNATGNSKDDWLGTAFSEMLSTELATGEKLRLVSGEEVANLHISSPWSPLGTLGPETAARIGTALNSDLLVLGSYTAIGQAQPHLRLDVRLQDTRTGEVLTQVAQTGNSVDLFRITAEIGAKLRERLGVPAISDTQEVGLLASLPSDREAARFYALGLAKLREFDALAAKDLFVQTIAADPEFSLGHAMLARAWGQLGYVQKQKEEARKSLDLSADLPRVDRMQVEGDYYASLPDHEKAESTYRALFELFPDSVEYGLRLAAAQHSAGHRNQAQETISRLRRLPAPASDDPRIDLADQTTLPDNRKAEVFLLLHNAENKASSQGKKLVYAQARLLECVSLVYGEHPDQADASCEDAYNIYRGAGNNLQAADALRMMADQQGGAGHIPQAIATYQRALKILDGMGEHLKTALIMNNMAIAYTDEGDLDRGEHYYRQSKFHFEQGGDKGNAAIALGNIADIFYLRGHLPSAARTYEQLIEINTAMENGDPAYPMYRLADLELTQGQVQHAHGLAVEAVESARSKNTEVAESMNELGEILVAEGDFQGARQQYQAALDIRQNKGRALDAAEDQMSLSEVSLEEGHPDQAESLLRPAIAEFEKDKADPNAASAYTLLSRALLSEEKLDEARVTIQRAAKLSQGSPDPAVKLTIAVQAARVEAALSEKSNSHTALTGTIQKLHLVIDSARRLGYYKVECEARLALAEVKLKTDPDTSRVQLEILEKETHNRGLELFAHRAGLLARTGQRSVSARSSPPAL
jgi:DNA-binding winged helix-turn-helix (wHTH) protein/tetratricopeptide (TPR) repeat protein/TolB-like protein